MRRRMMLLLVVFTLGMGSAYADVPRTINYQGRLTDLSGNALADGDYPVTVKLYSNISDPVGSALWTGVYPATTKNGYFSVVLGSGSYPFFSNLGFTQQYYLGIQVGIDSEMTPRQPLQSVPYAMNASANVLPIGTILAWHKSMTGTPALPPTFVECNGQTLVDTDSLYNGQVIPNLNGNSSGAELNNGDNLGKTGDVFLRGDETSGVTQVDAFQGHTFGAGGANNFALSNGSLGVAAGGDKFDNTAVMPNAGYPITDSINGTPRTGTVTRPRNMSVVWIMKVK